MIWIKKFQCLHWFSTVLVASLFVFGCDSKKNPPLPSPSLPPARATQMIAKEWLINGATAFGRLVVALPLKVELLIADDSSLTKEERKHLHVVLYKEGTQMPFRGFPALELGFRNKTQKSGKWYGVDFDSVPSGAYLIQIALHKPVVGEGGKEYIQIEPLVSSNITVK